ncbi:MAG: hypothetical protein ACR2JO_02110 [Mycobacteriales bacterium]
MIDQDRSGHVTPAAVPGLSPQPAFLPWPSLVGLATDVALLLATVALPVLAVLGVEGAIRQATALGVLCLAPGWGCARAAGLPASTLTMLIAVASSVAATMLVGLVAVTRVQWHWIYGVALIEFIALASLTLTLWRHHRLTLIGRRNRASRQGTR